MPYLTVKEQFILVDKVKKSGNMSKVNMIKEGEDFKSSLNCKFLAEYIDNISDNPVIKGSNASSMFEITEIGKDDYKYILMP